MCEARVYGSLGPWRHIRNLAAPPYRRRDQLVEVSIN